jgi:hypothetical protein
MVRFGNALILVLYWHREAAEGDHLSSLFDMVAVQRCLLQLIARLRRVAPKLVPSGSSEDTGAPLLRETAALQPFMGPLS